MMIGSSSALVPMILPEIFLLSSGKVSVCRSRLGPHKFLHYSSCVCAQRKEVVALFFGVFKCTRSVWRLLPGAQTFTLMSLHSVLVPSFPCGYKDILPAIIHSVLLVSRLPPWSPKYTWPHHKVYFPLGIPQLIPSPFNHHLFWWVLF